MLAFGRAFVSMGGFTVVIPAVSSVNISAWHSLLTGQLWDSWDMTDIQWTLVLSSLSSWQLVVAVRLTLTAIAVAL